MFNHSQENINHPLVKSYNKINAEVLNMKPEMCLFEKNMTEYLIWVNLQYKSVYGMDFKNNDELDAYISWIKNKFFDRSSYNSFLLEGNKKDYDNCEDCPEEDEYLYHIRSYTLPSQLPKNEKDMQSLSLYLWFLRQLLWGLWQRNSEDHLQDLIKEYAELHEIDLTSEKGRSHILSFLERELSNNS